MNRLNSILHYFGIPIHTDVRAYDINECRCLYLTNEGKTHYVSLFPDPEYTDDDFADGPDALDLYLLSDGTYIFVFRDRLEIRRPKSNKVTVRKIDIRPDFRLFKCSYTAELHYINGGTLYNIWGSRIGPVPDCKFVWNVFHDLPEESLCAAIEISYIDHDDRGRILSYGSNNVLVRPVTKVISTDTIEVYQGLFGGIILYCKDTGYAISGSCHSLAADITKCEIKTNGYQWTVFDGKKKYHYHDGFYFEIPIDVELAEAGHHIIRPVPVKSARF